MRGLGGECGGLGGNKRGRFYLCDSRIMAEGTLSQSVKRQPWEYAFGDLCEYSMHELCDVALIPSGELASNNVRGIGGARIM